MATIFTRIIKGEIPSYKVAEDEGHYAFLDIGPLAKGHTLVVPKREVDYIFDLDEAAYTALMLFTARVSAAIKDSMPCARVGMAVVGLEVAHAHVHLIPLQLNTTIDFTASKLSVDGAQMTAIAARIAEHFK